MATTPIANNTGSVTLNTVTTVNASVSSTVTSTSVLNIATVSETAYSFIRAKTITFFAEGLKPNTTYYPFFAGIYVGSFCATDDTSGGARLPRSLDNTLTEDIELVTDALGNLIGNFYLPPNTFTVGSHKFLLVDNVRTVPGSSVLIPDPIYGSAEARYEANGILKNMSASVTTRSQVESAVTATATTVSEVTVQLPPVVLCENRYFEYAIASSSDTVFTVTTNSPTPPSAASVSRQTGNAQLNATTTYLNTSVVVPDQTYHHFFAQRTSFGGSASNVRVFRQEWTGINTDPSPSLANFAPSGLASGEVVTILTGWQVGKTVVCPIELGFGTAPRQIASTNLQAQFQQWVDPLAQSFLIDSSTYPSGVFVTSIAVYFRTADQSSPVTLELRNMSNGSPGPVVLPGGKISMPGFACAQSVDASIATVFRFDFPVYLAPNQEYCFVLKSTSLGYNVWCSKTGAIDITTGKLIDTNPYLGVLFKSENDSTWIPDSYEDLKFDLNIASFDTSSVGEILFKPQTVEKSLRKNGSVPTTTDLYVGNALTLPLSYIRTTVNSKVIAVTIPVHGLKTGDYVTLTDIAVPTPSNAYNGLLVTQLVGTHQVTVIDSDNIEIDLPDATVATTTGIINTSDPSSYIRIDPAPSMEMPTYVAAIPYINNDTLSPTTLPTATALAVPVTPSFTSSTSFTVYVNNPINELMIDYLGTEFPNAQIIEQINTTDINYGNSAAYADIPFPRRFEVFDAPRLLPTRENEAVHNLNQGGLTVKMQLSSGDKYISPVINTNGMSLITRTYVIDNQEDEIDNVIAEIVADLSNDQEIVRKSWYNDSQVNSEIVSGQGRAAAKYKSTIQRLSQPYTKISIYVIGTCPSPAAIDAYIRLSADETTHFDRNWQWVPINGVYGTTGTGFIPSKNDKTTTEWRYDFVSDTPFTVFDIKLVMRTTNQSIVPKIYGIRTITN